MLTIRNETPSSNSGKIMVFGLLFACLSNLNFFAQITNTYWPWTNELPLLWLAAGLSYMMTFFHELGHTITAWFYGYFTLPTFDFVHGGGFAYQFGDQNWLILGTIYAALLFGIIKFRFHLTSQIILIAILLLNITTAFTPFHDTLIVFMGPASVSLIAGFFIYRAIFDLAPRGNFERFLNAYFGFAFIINIFIDCWGLLKNAQHRMYYNTQKGSHGIGDFDRIADSFINMTFENIIDIWLTLSLVCLTLPFLMFIIKKIRY